LDWGLFGGLIIFRRANLQFYPNPCKTSLAVAILSLPLVSLSPFAPFTRHYCLPLALTLSHSPQPPVAETQAPKPTLSAQHSLSHCSLSLGQFLSLAVPLSLRREALKSPPLSPWSSDSRHSLWGVDRNHGGNLFPPGTFSLRAQFLRFLPVSDLLDFNLIIGF
jgi:hypothetical protein